MQYTTDLNINPLVIKPLDLETILKNLTHWAKLKGVQLLGTGDCLHPLWKIKLQQQLDGGETGIYRFESIRFVLTAKVRLVYKQNNHTKVLDLLIIFPSFSAVNTLVQELEKNLNINLSTTKPEINLSAPEFCKLVFSKDPKIMILPIHIFSEEGGLFSSVTGFDFFIECFGSFSNSIFAVETGVESTPADCWRISELDNKAILSFSGATKLEDLAQEATIFNGNLTFDELIRAIKLQDIDKTLEYKNTSNNKRIEEIATRSISDLQLQKTTTGLKSLTYLNRPTFKYTIPLLEIISIALDADILDQSVQQQYQNLTTNLDNELNLLLITPIDLIQAVSNKKIAENIKILRDGRDIETNEMLKYQ